ncbi:MAG TPA: glycosyltransferase family 39 protein [Candidatus Binatia bacterium]|nr:glycosyltransferase family 39 protein [Candidatus Binatia bacterium]
MDPEKWRDCLCITLGEALVVLVLRPFQNTPFIDDWTYGWSVEWLLRHAELRILEWSSHLNVVQVLWGALFCLPAGFSFTALRVSTWVLAVACLWGLYWLLRELRVSRQGALLGTATLAVNPIFFMLSSTFMTDVPFLAFMVWASFAMVRAVGTERTGWLLAATILACLAIGVRLVGVVIPAAMAAVLLLHTGGWGRGKGRLWLTVLPLIFLGGLLWWGTEHLHHTADVSQLKDAPVNRVQNLRYALPLLPRTLVCGTAFVIGAVGLNLLPLSIACLRQDLGRRVTVSAFVLGLFLLILPLTSPTAIPLLSEGSTWTFSELGATEPLVAGFQPPSFPPWWSAAVTFAAWGSAAIFFAALGLSSPGQAFLGWLTLGHLLLMLMLWLFYDRYALVALPPAIGLLLAGGVSPRPALVLVCAALFGGISLVGVHDHLQYNQALWQAVDVLRQCGAPDSDIDGGYVVNGWLHYAHPENAPRDEQGNIVVPGLTTKTYPLRYQIANCPLPTRRLVTTISYRRWFGRSGAICILERETTPPSARAGSDAGRTHTGGEGE